MIHHRDNRILERVEYTSVAYYYIQLLGGLYIALLIWPLVLLFPGNDEIKDSFKPSWLVDWLLSLGLYALLYHYSHTVFWVVLGSRAFLYSFLDYIYHYGSPTNDRQQGYNLRLPCSWLILNFNLHGVHHKHPSLSWRDLPKVPHVLDGGYLEYSIRQLKGPL